MISGFPTAFTQDDRDQQHLLSAASCQIPQQSVPQSPFRINKYMPLESHYSPLAGYQNAQPVFIGERSLGMLWIGTCPGYL